MSYLPDNVAAVLTPPGVGAIAVLAVAGPGAAAAVAELTGRKKTFDISRCYLVKLIDNGESLDEAMVIRHAADIFEIHVHGGVAVVEAILSALARRNVRAIPVEKAAGPLRGFGVDDHESAIAAEVLAALPGASSVSAVRLLLAQRRGGLRAWAAENLSHLQRVGADDKGDDLLWRMSIQAQWMLVRAGPLQRLITPPRVAIMGPPNAGKSTLANILIGRPSSITSDQPGTTRDWIDSPAQIGHRDTRIPIVLVDTAGVRTTPADPIEIQAIARTHQQAQLADAIIFVLDGAAIPDKATYTWLENVIHESADRSCPLILAINKSDEPIGWTGQEIQGPFATISISALMGQGLDVLQSQLAKALDLGDFNAQEAWIFTPRQRKIMARLAEAADVAAAAADLAELLHGPR